MMRPSLALVAAVLLHHMCFIDSFLPFVRFHSCSSWAATQSRCTGSFVESEVSSTSQYPPRGQSSTESLIRNSIIKKQWDRAADILSTLECSDFVSGRNIVYVICETCRRNNNISAILPLLQRIPTDVFRCTEDDIMPLLTFCAGRGTFRKLQPLISYLLYEKSIKFGGKAFTTLISGYGKQKNELMVERILWLCVRQGLNPDIVLLNSAMDAYIRCGSIDKALSLFNAATMQENATTSTATLSSAAIGDVKSKLSRRTEHIESKLKEKLRTYDEDDLFDELLQPISSAPSSSSSSSNNNRYSGGGSSGQDPAESGGGDSALQDATSRRSGSGASSSAGGIGLNGKLIPFPPPPATSSSSAAADAPSSSASRISAGPFNGNKVVRADPPAGERPRVESMTTEDIGVRLMKNRGLVPNIRTYNTLIKGFRGADAKSFERCLSVLDSMDAVFKHIKPDAVTVNTLVDACVMTGDLDRAEKILLNPLAEPGVEAYTSLISGFANRGGVSSAFRVLEIMTLRGVQPNSYTLTSLMNACITAGKIKSARRLLQYCTAISATPRTTSTSSPSFSSSSSSSPAYSGQSSYLDASSRSNNSSSTALEDEHSNSSSTASNPLLALNQPLSSSELSALYGSYVIGLCRTFKTRAAAAASAMAYAVANDPLAASSIGDTRTLAANAGAKYGKYLEEARRALIEMDRRAISPDIATLNAFTNGMCSLQQPPRMREPLLLIRIAAQYGILPDDYTYSILFTALGRGGMYDQAMQFYRSVSADGIQLDTPAINSLIRSFVSGPSPLHAVSLFYELTNSTDIAAGEVEQFVPSKITFTILFLAISRFIAPERWSVSESRRGYFSQQQELSSTAGLNSKGEEGSEYDERIASAAASVLAGYNADTEYVLIDRTVAKNKVSSTELGPLGQFFSSFEFVTRAVQRECERQMLGQKTFYAAPAPPPTSSSSSSFPQQELPAAKVPVREQVSYVVEDNSYGRERAADDDSASGSLQPLVYDSTTGRMYEASLRNGASKEMPKEMSIGASSANSAYSASATAETSSTGRHSSGVRNGNDDGKKGMRAEDSSVEDSSTSATTVRDASVRGVLREQSGAIGKGTIRENSKVLSAAFTQNPDLLVRDLFKKMRFGYRIEPDDVLVSAINSLFSCQQELASKSLSLGKYQFSGFSKETSRLVFEDLVVSAGVHPQQLTHVLQSCRFTQRQANDFLYDEAFLKKLRKSAASARIFSKYGWNKMDSGWSPFF